jgi:hypothetical protein
LLLATGFADVHYNLADVLEELGRTAEARPHWQAYMQKDGSSQWAAYAQKRLFPTRLIPGKTSAL